MRAALHVDVDQLTLVENFVMLMGARLIAALAIHSVGAAATVRPDKADYAAPDRLGALKGVYGAAQPAAL